MEREAAMSGLGPWTSFTSLYILYSTSHDGFEEGTEPRVCDLRSPTKLQKQLHQWLITYDSYVKGLEPWGPQPSLHDMMKYNPRYDLLGWNKKKALVVTEMGLPLHISLPAV